MASEQQRAEWRERKARSLRRKRSAAQRKLYLKRWRLENPSRVAAHRQRSRVTFISLDAIPGYEANVLVYHRMPYDDLLEREAA